MRGRRRRPLLCPKKVVGPRADCEVESVGPATACDRHSTLESDGVLTKSVMPTSCLARVPVSTWCSLRFDCHVRSAVEAGACVRRTSAHAVSGIGLLDGMRQRCVACARCSLLCSTCTSQTLQSCAVISEESSCDLEHLDKVFGDGQNKLHVSNHRSCHALRRCVPLLCGTDVAQVSACLEVAPCVFPRYQEGDRLAICFGWCGLSSMRVDEERFRVTHELKVGTVKIKQGL